MTLKDRRCEDHPTMAYKLHNKLVDITHQPIKLLQT